MTCGHDGWVKGCQECETNEAAALEAMGEVVEPPPRCAVCTRFITGPHQVALDGSAVHLHCSAFIDSEQGADSDY